MSPTKLLIPLIAAISLAGCGSSTVSPSQADKVSAAAVAFTHQCLDGSMAGQVPRGVSDVIAVFRADPSASYGGHTMRQVLADDAGYLSCDPRQAQKLRDALAAG